MEMDASLAKKWCGWPGEGKTEQGKSWQLSHLPARRMRTQRPAVQHPHRTAPPGKERERENASLRRGKRERGERRLVVIKI